MSAEWDVKNSCLRHVTDVGMLPELKEESLDEEEMWKILNWSNL